MKLLFPLAMVLLVVVLSDASLESDDDSYVRSEIERKAPGKKNSTSPAPSKSPNKNKPATTKKARVAVPKRTTVSTVIQKWINFN